jgi:hypothetical protein
MEEFNERDLFAGLAMVGLLAKGGYNLALTTQAYGIADAMLKTREHQDPEEGIAAIPTRKR